MKVAIVGGTGHSSVVTKAAENNSKIKICGVAPGPEGGSLEGILKRAVKSNPEAKWYPDYLTLIEKAEPQVMVIASYCGYHGEIAIECIKRGIHVYTEKPAATTLEQLKELEKVYFGQNQAKLSAMMISRYYSFFLAAKQAIEKGEIGEIRLFQGQKSYVFGSRNGMYEDSKMYGGTIPWVGSHALDWVHWLSGLEFKSIFARQSRKFNQGIGSLETTAVLNFEMEKEVLGTVSLDLLWPEGADSHGGDALRILGTKGEITIQDSKAILINEKTVVELEGEKNVQPFEEFLKFLRGEPSRQVSAEEVFTVTRACLYGRESAETGKIMYW